MAQVLCQLPKSKKPTELLVGNETADDAGVYQLTEEIALVQTVDFFTPVVDDPYMFGQIAAANALSDVYAMGGVPKTAMNIVAYPIQTLGSEILAEILRGAADKVAESGAVIIGGHSIDDKEPKFGLSVTGVVSPRNFWKNSGAKIGDVLILTKPIGVGILTTGIKRGKVTKEQETVVTETMSMLNKKSAEILQKYHPNAVTDVTGFGLLGHASEMAEGSDVSIQLFAHSVPLLPGTKSLAKDGVVPGGSKANARWLASKVFYDECMDEYFRLILCDAVTSGGLLIALPEVEVEAYVEEMQKKNLCCEKIGRVTERRENSIYVYSKKFEQVASKK